MKVEERVPSSVMSAKITPGCSVPTLLDRPQEEEPLQIIHYLPELEVHEPRNQCYAKLLTTTELGEGRSISGQRLKQKRMQTNEMTSRRISVGGKRLARSGLDLSKFDLLLGVCFSFCVSYVVRALANSGIRSVHHSFLAVIQVYLQTSICMIHQAYDVPTSR